MTRFLHDVMSLIKGVARLHFGSLNDLTAHAILNVRAFCHPAFQPLPSPQAKLNVLNARPDWVKGRTVICNKKFKKEGFKSVFYISEMNVN